MSIISDFEAHVDLLVTAIDSGDYAEMRKEAMKIEAMLLKIPDINSQSHSVRYSRENVKELLKRVDDYEAVSKRSSSRVGRVAFRNVGS